MEPRIIRVKNDEEFEDKVLKAHGLPGLDIVTMPLGDGQRRRAIIFGSGSDSVQIDMMRTSEDLRIDEKKLDC